MLSMCIAVKNRITQIDHSIQIFMNVSLTHHYKMLLQCIVQLYSSWLRLFTQQWS